ncbi:TOBE domain-containing protein [Roseibium salinum]|nr:TOBE domain-containing protein [Roseibium salinum]
MNLLDVKSNGRGLALASGNGLSGANAKGKDSYVLGVRPEHLEVVDGPASGDGVALEVTVDVLEPVGAETYIYASFDEGGPEIVVRVSSHAVHHVGERLHLRAAPDYVHFFDPDTGKTGRLISGQGRRQTSRPHPDALPPTRQAAPPAA